MSGAAGASAAAGRPVLYSFRRCPYAIRARMALLQAAMRVDLREVVLRDKPRAMLQASPKGTVPVLVLPDGRVIDESLAIMRWALAQSDCRDWLVAADAPAQQHLLALNDGPFKQALDAYKYPERHPEFSQSAHRARGEEALVAQLETRLAAQPFLAGATAGLTDLAIFPFVRQWAAVDGAWFQASGWTNVRRWLDAWLADAAFAHAMRKYAPWQAGEEPVVFPPDGS